ncbi:hypothetical protein EDD16DRAFT_878517 [Pisolithus croceorrhizus]|nr:hypothetical protein EV401DRAFT_623581 [Pisolithus croceorrhizus]KAI6120425.1 hypothetical protein EDD16DRAFT_878517 [Pisolithus croceorrhizus]
MRLVTGFLSWSTVFFVHLTHGLVTLLNYYSRTSSTCSLFPLAKVSNIVLKRSPCWRSQPFFWISVFSPFTHLEGSIFRWTTTRPPNPPSTFRSRRGPLSSSEGSVFAPPMYGREKRNLYHSQDHLASYRISARGYLHSDRYR